MCRKNLIYREKEYYYVGSRSFASITVRQVNDAMGEVYPCRTRLVVNNATASAATTTATSTTATTTKKVTCNCYP